MLGPARELTGQVGSGQAVMDGVPHPLGRTTLSVCPAGSLGVALWGEAPVVVHGGNVLDNTLLWAPFPSQPPY